MIQGFIKLRRRHSGAALRISVAHIVAYFETTEDEGSTVVTDESDDGMWFVQETPEDIDRLIVESRL